MLRSDLKIYRVDAGQLDFRPPTDEDLREMGLCETERLEKVIAELAMIKSDREYLAERLKEVQAELKTEKQNVHIAIDSARESRDKVDQMLADETQSREKAERKLEEAKEVLRKMSTRLVELQLQALESKPTLPTREALEKLIDEFYDGRMSGSLALADAILIACQQAPRNVLDVDHMAETGHVRTTDEACPDCAAEERTKREKAERELEIAQRTIAELMRHRDELQIRLASAPTSDRAAQLLGMALIAIGDPDESETSVRDLIAKIQSFFAEDFDAQVEAGANQAKPEPLPMLLHCPECNARHIDEGEFATKPHHTHSCQNCGLTWRPAVVPTVGVQFLPGFKNEEPVRPLQAEDWVIRRRGTSRFPGRITTTMEQDVRVHWPSGAREWVPREHLMRVEEPRERPAMTHVLKTAPGPYQAIVDGKKRFEWRRNDRDFMVGDVLRLKEYDASSDTWTGRELTALVTYILKEGFEIPAGFCVMGIDVEAAKQALLRAQQAFAAELRQGREEVLAVGAELDRLAEQKSRRSPTTSKGHGNLAGTRPPEIGCVPRQETGERGKDEPLPSAGAPAEARPAPVSDADIGHRLSTLVFDFRRKEDSDGVNGGFYKRVASVLALLTDEQIRELREEAQAGDDSACIAMCNAALDGDPVSRYAVANAIAEAEALADEHFPTGF